MRGSKPIQTWPERTLNADRSPWVVESRHRWRGIRVAVSAAASTTPPIQVSFIDCLEDLNTTRWLPRDDTFAGNLIACFVPLTWSNVAGPGRYLA